MTTTITRAHARPASAPWTRRVSLLDSLETDSVAARGDDSQMSADGSPTGLPLGRLFCAHRGRLLLTYAMSFAENALRVAQPLVLGLAINDLLSASYRGLLVFAVQHLAYMLIGAARQMHDTRVFTSVHAGVATRLIAEQQSSEVDAQRGAARWAKSREYVDFFEQSMPMLTHTTFSIAGALLMLGWYSPTLVPLCLLLILPAALLNAALGRRTSLLSGRLHDEYESEAAVIASGDPRKTRRHMEALSNWRVKLSDSEAINFALMELFVLGLIATTLVHFCTSGNGAAGSPAAGDIFAVFRYVLLFVTGVEAVPRLAQHIAKLGNIRPLT